MRRQEVKSLAPGCVCTAQRDLGEERRESGTLQAKIGLRASEELIASGAVGGSLFHLPEGYENNLRPGAIGSRRADWGVAREERRRTAWYYSRRLCRDPVRCGGEVSPGNRKRIRGSRVSAELARGGTGSGARLRKRRQLRLGNFSYALPGETLSGGVAHRSRGLSGARA